MNSCDFLYLIFARSYPGFSEKVDFFLIFSWLAYRMHIVKGPTGISQETPRGLVVSLGYFRKGQQK